MEVVFSGHAADRAGFEEFQAYLLARPDAAPFAERVGRKIIEHFGVSSEDVQALRKDLMTAMSSRLDAMRNTPQIKQQMAHGGQPAGLALIRGAGAKALGVTKSPEAYREGSPAAIMLDSGFCDGPWLHKLDAVSGSHESAGATFVIRQPSANLSTGISHLFFEPGEEPALGVNVAHGDASAEQTVAFLKLLGAQEKNDVWWLREPVSIESVLDRILIDQKLEAFEKVFEAGQGQAARSAVYAYEELVQQHSPLLGLAITLDRSVRDGLAEGNQMALARLNSNSGIDSREIQLYLKLARRVLDASPSRLALEERALDEIAKRAV